MILKAGRVGINARFARVKHSPLSVGAVELVDDRDHHMMGSCMIETCHVAVGGMI